MSTARVATARGSLRADKRQADGILMWASLATCVLALPACGRIAFDINDAGMDEPGDLLIDGAAVDPSLVLWLPFDDVMIPHSDASLHRHQPACQGGCPTSIPGIRDKAGGFDGGRYLTVADSPLFRLPAFTLAVWHNATAAEMTGFGKPLGSQSANSWELGLGGLSPGICTGASPISPSTCDLSPTPVTLSTWTHIAATWDGVTMELFHDGVFVVGGGRSIAYDNNAIHIGCDFEMGGTRYCLDGAMDDLRIYDRVLEANEIAALATP